MKTLRTVFLALGLAMIWLGVFYNYELKKQSVAIEESAPATPVKGFDTYTLENNQYEGEYSPQTEFTFLNETDSSVLLMEEVPAVNIVTTAGFSQEFDLLEQEQRSSGNFPILLIVSGVLFLFFGVLFLKKSTGSRLTIR